MLAFLVGITILNQKIVYKDDTKIVPEFPGLFGHPESSLNCKNPYLNPCGQRVVIRYVCFPDLYININPLTSSGRFWKKCPL